MSLFDTLAASRSAIDFYSDKLSLIGINIASTQSAGYNRQRQLATDNFYQQLSSAGAAGGVSNAGGVASTPTQSIFTVGTLDATGQPTNLAINGRGYFPVEDATTGELLLTRVGNFDLDADGYMRLPTGQKLLGIQGEAPAFQVSLDAQNNLVFTVDPTSANATAGTTGSALKLETQGVSWSDDTLSFASTAPAGGTAFPVLSDGTILTATSLNQTLATLNSGRGLDVGKHYTSFQELEMDIARGGVSVQQADAALLTATGGNGFNLSSGTYRSVVELRAAVNAMDSSTTIAEIDAAIASSTTDGLQLAWASESDLRAGLSAGNLTQAEVNSALASTPLTVGGRTFDGSVGQEWDDLQGLMPINPNTGDPYTLAEIEESAPNALGVEIAADGEVQWRFSNGTTAPAAWLRLANVRDPSALEAVGESLYAATDSAYLIGDWQTNVPDAGGLGSLVAGTIEMSNVDLTTEFADLLASQRSFQANSKMLTIMDELLDTVTNLRR